MIINIVNWLVTRKCNLRCQYCGIIRNNVPQKEMKLDDIERILHVIEKYNSPFHILYGGEPLIRKDIDDIIQCFVNVVTQDRFTIYHNATAPDKFTTLIEKYELKHVTCSVDPVSQNEHRRLKSSKGVKLLSEIKNRFNIDAVATLTVDRYNYLHLYDTVKLLTELGIYSNITVYDPVGSKFYDFSVNNSKSDELYTVYSHHINVIFDNIKTEAKSGKLLVHFPDLLDAIVKSVPRNYRCLEPWKALTVDADGSIRLCLRIRGNADRYTHYFFNDQTMFMKEIKDDQNVMCNGCVWTCIMMAEQGMNVKCHK